jgi:hypothetical protein
VDVGALSMAAAALLFVSTAAALARPARAQPLPAISAALSAPGAAPECLPASATTYIPVAGGPTGVLLRGRGFKPGERVSFGWLGTTRTPPTTSIVYHDVLPIADVIADGSGSFACEVYLSLHFDGTPFYYQIGAFAQSTLGLEGTELLPAAVLFVPAMPPTGSGGNIASTARSNGAAMLFVTVTALLALAVAGSRLAVRVERRQALRKRGAP